MVRDLLWVSKFKLKFESLIAFLRNVERVDLQVLNLRVFRLWEDLNILAGYVSDWLRERKYGQPIVVNALQFNLKFFVLFDVKRVAYRLYFTKCSVVEIISRLK
jgi:hypothetical protein